MELIEEMKKCLPIPVYPTRRLRNYLQYEDVDINKKEDLQITDIFDSGESGGIVCTIVKEKGKVFLASLTHLKIKPGLPLFDRIHEYQLSRMKSISNRSFNVTVIDD